MHVFERRVELRTDVVQCTGQPTNLIGQKIWPTSKKCQNYGPKRKTKTQQVEKKKIFGLIFALLCQLFLAV